MKNENWKKNPSSLFVQIEFSKRCAKFPLKEIALEILVILRFLKIVLHSKIINETCTLKNLENPTHHFGEDYHTNHLPKFLQDRIKPLRVAALRVSADINFCIKNLLMKLL